MNPPAPLISTSIPTAPSTLPASDAARAKVAANATIRTLRAWTPRRGLVIGLVLSLAVHLAFSFWPDDRETPPDALPLQASIVEMPPPPLPAATATVKVRPRPQRKTASRPPEPATPAVEAAVAVEPEQPAIEPTPEAIATGPDLPIETVAAAAPGAVPEEPPKTLPRRVDLVYKAFLGSQGFLIGEAVYRFEHSGHEYHIMTIGEAKGLAAIFVRGQGKLESRGLITATGLRPNEFAVERGSSERREIAVFDWEIGMVTLHEKTESLEPSTFDPLTLMWQAYFTPPVDDVQDISVATTRRVGRYTLTREAEETIQWPQGEIVTERWRRRSEDGNTDTTIWLAPSLRYVPVKMRLKTNYRSMFGATLEATLDSIRVDETLARQ